MNRESIRIATRCSRCGHAAFMTATHWIDASGARKYAEEFRCEQCAALATSDGLALSAEVRSALLRRDGTWQVRITNAGARPVDVVRFVRDRYEISLGEALTRATTSLPLQCGTAVEVAEVALRLGEIGALAVVERVDSAPRT